MEPKNSLPIAQLTLQPGAELDRRLKGDLPADWEEAFPTYPADAKGMATRFGFWRGDPMQSPGNSRN